MAEIVEESSATAAYDDTQQLFALNFAANAVAKRTGTQDVLELQLEAALIYVLLKKLPGWKLVWGPKVWKPDPDSSGTPPTNAWYVAAKGPKFVLAIAGTAPDSWAGWWQDFDVINTVRWDKWVGSWPKQGAIPPPQTDQAKDSLATIAFGTAQGVKNIMTNKSVRVARGTYVQDFLQSQHDGTQIYVVGHSMGGALAPTVGLGLLDSQMITNKKISVLASAGASPGNVVFAQAWAAKIPDGNLYNANDIVPQAWQVAAGKDRCFPNIYNVIFKGQDPNILQGITETTQNLGEKTSKASGITYSPVRGKPFTRSDFPIPKMKNLKQELPGVIHQQHVQAYLKELGLEDLIKRFELKLDDNDNIGHVEPQMENIPDDN